MVSNIRWMLHIRSRSTIARHHYLDKSTILIISAIIELFWELVISNMQNKFEQNTWKTIMSLGNVNAKAEVDYTKLRLQLKNK